MEAGGGATLVTEGFGRALWGAVAFWCMLLWSLAAHALVPVPVQFEPVTDLADALPPDVREELNRSLKAHYEAGHAQIAVLTLQTTDGEPVEDFAFRVASAWKLGRAGKDDGVLFVLATEDRRMRLEVGYGLEQCIPDATARAWLDDLKPKLGDKHYGAATSQLVSELTYRTTHCQRDGASAPAPTPAAGLGQPQQSTTLPAWMLAFVLASLVGRLVFAADEWRNGSGASIKARPGLWGVAVGSGVVVGLGVWLWGYSWLHIVPATVGAVLGGRYMWRVRSLFQTVFMLAFLGIATTIIQGLTEAGMQVLLPSVVAVFLSFIYGLNDLQGSSTTFGTLDSSSDADIAAFMRSGTQAPNTSFGSSLPDSGGSLFDSGSSSFDFGSSSSGGSDYSGGGGSFGGGGASSSW